MRFAIVAGVIVAIAGIVYYARDSRGPAAAPQAEPSTRAVTPARPPSTPARVTASVDEDRPEVEVNRDPPPAELHPKVVEITDNPVARVEAVQAHIRDVARPCVANVDRARLAGQLRVRYTVRIEASRARTVAAKLMMSSLGDPVIEACVVDAIAGAAWPVTWPDGVIPIADKIELIDLAR